MIIWCIVTLPAIGLEVSICIRTESITNSKDFLRSFPQNRKKKRQKYDTEAGFEQQQSTALEFSQLKSLWIRVSRFICAYTQMDEAPILYS